MSQNTKVSVKNLTQKYTMRQPQPVHKPIVRLRFVEFANDAPGGITAAVIHK